MQHELQRYSAFTVDPSGGNPAGVWIGKALPDVDDMQRIAREVGYSETAFLAPAAGNRWQVRYFSPEVEVPFCGHATIASGVAIAGAEGDGLYALDTPAGRVFVSVTTPDGIPQASLTSVEPKFELADDALLDEVLPLLGWRRGDLDESLPAARAFAGAWHLVLAVADRAVLRALDYDFDGMRSAMHGAGLTTLQLVWRESESLFHSRNPFPVGGVVEDPATGAAAAALGGYLRDAGLVRAPAEITIRQGEDMGRPSTLRVRIPATGGIIVSGNAVPIR